MSLDFSTDPQNHRKNTSALKETEIGMLPAEWDVVPLGDLSEVNYGKARPKTEGSIPVVGSGGIYASADNALVYSPTIVIGRKGSAGRTWLIENPCWPSDTTFYLELTERINLYFLFSYLTLNPLSGQHAKTTLPSLSRPYLESYPVPVPPLPEQRRIAGALRIIQEAIAVQEDVIAAARELKHSLMERLFTYGPGAEPAPTKETEIGEIPEHWETVPFEDAIRNKRVRAGKIKESNYKPSGDFPIIDQGQDLIGGYWNDPEALYKGELPVIIFGDHTRIFKFVDFPFIRGADGVKILIPHRQKFTSPFFYYACLNLDIPSRGYNRHYKYLKEKSLPMPPLPEQQQITKILSIIDQKTSTEEQHKAALEDLFRSTLEQLMTGQIRLREEPIEKT